MALVGVLVTTVVASPLALAGGGPANDRFGDAIELPRALPVTSVTNSAGATGQANEPESICTGNDRTVWYRWTPGRNMIVRADTVGSEIDADVAIWRGHGVLDLVQVGCSYGSGTDPYDPDARVTFRARAGVTYHFQLLPGDSPDGNMRLNLREVDPPSNDRFRDARWINDYPFDATVDITHATSESQLWRSDCEDLMATVWYRTMPAVDMVLRIDTYGTDFDTMLAVFTGDRLGQLERVACVDDTQPTSETGYESRISFRAKGQTVYYIAVGGYDNEVGDLDLNVRRVTPPSNDQFTDARVVGSLPHGSVSNTTNATIQARELQPTCESAYQTVWYAYTPPTNTQLEATALLPDASSFVQVYTGPSLGSLQAVTSACGSTATFDATGGTTYWFQVAGDFDDSGPVDFSLEEVP
jgi:hypothetical protein